MPPQIQVGDQLEIKVIKALQDQTVVRIADRLMLSNLLKGAAEGDKLQVEVTQTTPKLILKILEHLKDLSPEGKNALQQVIEKALGTEQLEVFRKLTFHSPKQPLDTTLIKSSFTEPESSPELTQLKELILEKLAVSSKNLAAPRDLSTLLQQFSDNEELPLLRQIMESSKNILSQRSQEVLPERVAREIKGYLKELLQQLPENPAEGPPVIRQATHEIFLLRLTETVSELSSPDIKNTILRALGTIREEPSLPRQILTGLEKALQVLQQLPQSQEIPLTQLLERLIVQFQALAGKGGSLGTTDLSAGMRKAIEQAFEQMESNRSSSGTAQDAGRRGQELQRSIGLLENFVQGQEALNRANPLMQSAGEPIFILLPALFEGLLSSLELSIRPRETGDKKKSGQGSEGYERFNFSLTFPNIGKIRVDAAYRSNEVLMSFTLENEEIVDFLDAYLPKLERKLLERGYESAQLIARLGQPRASRPKWVNELQRRSIIA